MNVIPNPKFQFREPQNGGHGVFCPTSSGHPPSAALKYFVYRLNLQLSTNFVSYLPSLLMRFLWCLVREFIVGLSPTWLDVYTVNALYKALKTIIWFCVLSATFEIGIQISSLLKFSKHPRLDLKFGCFYCCVCVLCLLHYNHGSLPVFKIIPMITV